MKGKGGWSALSDYSGAGRKGQFFQRENECRVSALVVNTCVAFQPSIPSTFYAGGYLGCNTDCSHRSSHCSYRAFPDSGSFLLGPELANAKLDLKFFPPLLSPHFCPSVSCSLPSWQLHLAMLEHKNPPSLWAELLAGSSLLWKKTSEATQGEIRRGEKIKMERKEGERTRVCEESGWEGEWRIKNDQN